MLSCIPPTRASFHSRYYVEREVRFTGGLIVALFKRRFFDVAYSTLQCSQAGIGCDYLTIILCSSQTVLFSALVQNHRGQSLFND